MRDSHSSQRGDRRPTGSPRAQSDSIHASHRGHDHPALSTSIGAPVRRPAAAGRSVAPATTTEDQLGREVWIVASVVILGVIMSLLDTTIVNVALDTLARKLHSPLVTIQWVSAGYLLALALVIPLTGWLSERFGAKRVWMLAVAAFAVGSALCGLAWSAGSLILFRVLQGLGGGMIMPVGMSLLAQTSGPKKVGRVMSVMGVPMLLGPILGPVIGGLIVSNLAWRWIFYVNVPIALVALLLARRFLDPEAGRADAGRLDWRGFCLLSPGLVAILFGLSEAAPHGGFAAPIVLAPILAGVVLIAAFTCHSLRMQRPLIDIRLFRGSRFSAAAGTSFLLGAALFGAMLVIPLYYQTVRHTSALGAGLLMAPGGLGAALAMPLAGRFTDRVGGGPVALVGIAMVSIGTIAFASIGPSSSFVLLALSLVVRGIGLGAAMMPAMSAAYATLRPDEIPRATSALNAIQRVGSALGTALLAVVLQQQISTQLPSNGAARIGATTNASAHAAAGPLANAFAHTFWWALGLTLIAAVPAATLAIAQLTSRSEKAVTMRAALATRR